MLLGATLMSAGRRGFGLAVVFLSAACTLCPDRHVRAQPVIQPFGQPQNTGKHKIWQNDVSPDRIRNALERFGKGEPQTNESFEKLIRDLVKKNNPNAKPEEVEAALKKMLANKELMNQLTDIAQKHKNQTPNFNPNQVPKLTPDEIEKLKNVFPKGEQPFQIPKFDPKMFPFDPDNPPKIDPKTQLPIDPNTGQPIDPKNLPKFNQPPKFEPPKFDNPPKLNDPKTPPPPPDLRDFDKANPLGTPKQTPEQLAKAKAAETVTALWEKNVGPIEESPAVKRAILDLVSDPEAMAALTDDKGNSFFDMFRDDGNNESLKDLFGDTGGKWEWPKLDLGVDWNWGGKGNFDVGNSRPRLPESSSRWPSSPNTSFNGLGSFNFGGMQVPWLLALIVLALIVAVVVWWKWEVLFQPRDRLAFAGANGGIGPWPVDPRNINTREDIVKAFEYLSVLICGSRAKTWTHSTIAEELIALVATHGETAVKLARLYELARYAPLDEPLTRAEVLEARRLVCDLAGVDEA